MWPQGGPRSTRVRSDRAPWVAALRDAACYALPVPGGAESLIPAIAPCIPPLAELTGPLSTLWNYVLLSFWESTMIEIHLSCRVPRPLCATGSQNPPSRSQTSGTPLPVLLHGSLSSGHRAPAWTGALGMMEWVPGGVSQPLVRQGCLEVPVMLEWGVALGEQTEQCWAKGCAHRRTDPCECLNPNATTGLLGGMS